MRFTEKLQNRIKASGSRLCVGLDPRPGEHGSDYAKDFLLRVVEETSPWAAAFKPNMAYFEAMGIEGIRVLEEILASIPEEIPVILDAKRSDIGETQKYYAQGYFNGWNVDAVTLNPFLGYDSIEPFLDYEGKAVYLLAVTSNAGSAEFQQQELADGWVGTSLIPEHADFRLTALKRNVPATHFVPHAQYATSRGRVAIARARRAARSRAPGTPAVISASAARAATPRSLPRAWARRLPQECPS